MDLIDRVRAELHEASEGMTWPGSDYVVKAVPYSRLLEVLGGIQAEERGGDSREEDLYAQVVRRYYVEFGGLGGEIAEMVMTREAYSALGSPGTIRVTVKALFEEKEEQ